MLIIDGHNLIGRCKDLHFDDSAVKDKLIAKLKLYQQIVGGKIILAFDGQGFGGFERTQEGHIEVLYPSEGQTADEVIKNLMEKHSHDSSITVVTSDREISKLSRIHHLKHLTSNIFAQQIEEIIFRFHNDIEQYLCPVNLDDWLKYFQSRKKPYD